MQGQTLGMRQRRASVSRARGMAALESQEADRQERAEYKIQTASWAGAMAQQLRAAMSQYHVKWLTIA